MIRIVNSVPQHLSQRISGRRENTLQRFCFVGAKDQHTSNHMKGSWQKCDFITRNLQIKYGLRERVNAERTKGGL